MASSPPSAVVASLTAAQEALARHDVGRIFTLGGECSVSVAPFAALAEKYGDDLAVVWVDSHLTGFGPDDLRESTAPLLDWLAGTGASKLAIHFDVDVVDSDEIALGLARFPEA